MSEKYQKLLDHLSDIHNIDMTASFLGYDQETYMPPGGTAARASQLATLSRISHQMMTSDKTARLLEDAAAELESADYDSDEASMIRVAQRDYEDLTKLPTEFVAELTKTTSLAQEVWVKARANNDFAAFLPALQKIIEMKKQEAEYRGYEEHPYDALLNQYERGMTAVRVKEIFDAHKPGLIELIAAISENSNRVSDAVLRQEFDVDKQREFGTYIAESVGFDFERGAQAISAHPFTSHSSVNDVRFTARYYPDFFNTGLFSVMHETGHGMYEQGVAQSLEGTILARGTSLAVHESQSRMWENLVGRSRHFWIWALPKLQEVFPAQFGNVDVDAMYRAVNKVAPSYIRVEADEATYNLHIMLRFELEMDVIAGDVEVADLPEVWNTRFEEFLGIKPPNDAEGVLQDVHWAFGLYGYFSTYALGNLLSVQYYNRALKDHPNIPDEIAAGEFDTLLGWMQEHIHQHGRKFTPEELTLRVTGQSIQSDDYLAYLKGKYGQIYGL